MNVKGSNPGKSTKNLKTNAWVEEACVCGSNTSYNAFATGKEKPHFFTLSVLKIEQFIAERTGTITCPNSGSTDPLKSAQTKRNILGG